VGATQTRAQIVTELQEMIQDPTDFYRTRPTVDRVGLANSICETLQADGDELDRLRTFAVAVRGLLGVAFPDVRLEELLVEEQHGTPLPAQQLRVVGER
jgi:hypothetical protein